MMLYNANVCEISLSESRFDKKWQTSSIIREISDSNLETGRKGSKSSLPGHPGELTALVAV